jgi:GWxTD domain-containing protein
MRAWAEGPVRWLMLPSEAREFERLVNDGEARLFVDEFWRRRDPDPGSDENRVREEFLLRVAQADDAYREGERRGAMTDRGRALVLLGSPPLLRHGYRAAPAPSWRDRTGRPMPVRSMAVESWEYADRDLPAALVALLDAEGEGGVKITFAIGDQGARLIEGERYLELAAQATVRLVGLSQG